MKDQMSLPLHEALENAADAAQIYVSPAGKNQVTETKLASAKTNKSIIIILLSLHHRELS